LCRKNSIYSEYIVDFTEIALSLNFSQYLETQASAVCRFIEIKRKKSIALIVGANLPKSGMGNNYR
jgi:hypothetical protein